MKKLSTLLTDYYCHLKEPKNLPRNIGVLFPQKEKDVQRVIKLFFEKFYNDSKPRHLVLGINPGRYGAGITGINFTAPRQLKENCGIDNPFGNGSELSAQFIYEMIDAYGGPKKFYSRFFLAALSPLGYVKGGRNLNYYDDKDLEKAVTPFITAQVKKHIELGGLTDACICIGGEKNYKFLQQLNNRKNFFKKIIPLPHPRFIMQYRLKQKQKYIDEYLQALKKLKS